MTPFDTQAALAEVGRLWPRSRWAVQEWDVFTEGLRGIRCDAEQAVAAIREEKRMSVYPSPNMASMTKRLRALGADQGRKRSHDGPKPYAQPDEAAIIDAHNQRTQEWIDAMPDDELAEFWVWVLAKPEARQLGMHRRDRAFLKESPFTRGVMFAFAHPPMELGR